MVYRPTVSFSITSGNVRSKCRTRIAGILYAAFRRAPETRNSFAASRLYIITVAFIDFVGRFRAAIEREIESTVAAYKFLCYTYAGRLISEWASEMILLPGGKHHRTCYKNSTIPVFGIQNDHEGNTDGIQRSPLERKNLTISILSPQDECFRSGEKIANGSPETLKPNDPWTPSREMDHLRWIRPRFEGDDRERSIPWRSRSRSKENRFPWSSYLGSGIFW